MNVDNSLLSPVTLHMEIHVDVHALQINLLKINHRQLFNYEV